MKVGDLVELKDSVLREENPRDTLPLNPNRPFRWLGVIIDKHQNAIKVHWFKNKNGHPVPPTSQYVLKVRVVSEL